MGLRLATCLVAVAACYRPLVPEGAPCESAEDCPAPLQCNAAGRCTGDPGGPHDVAADGAIDARSVDAAPDAPADAAIPAACENTVVCPSGGTKTYFLCGSDCIILCSTSAPFWEAHEICTAGATRLARVNTSADQACFEAHLATLTEEAWIGLLQEPDAPTPTSGWIWSNGIPLSFANWASPPEPNDGDGLEDGLEQCAAYYPDGTWHDTPCLGPSRRVLCEVDH